MPGDSFRKARPFKARPKSTLTFDEIGTLYLIRTYGPWEPFCSYEPWRSGNNNRARLKNLTRKGFLIQTRREYPSSEIAGGFGWVYSLSDAGVSVLAELQKADDITYLDVVYSTEQFEAKHGKIANPRVVRYWFMYKTQPDKDTPAPDLGSMCECGHDYGDHYFAAPGCTKCKCAGFDLAIPVDSQSPIP